MFYFMSVILIISVVLFLRDKGFHIVNIIVSLLVIFASFLSFMIGIICNRTEKAIDKEQDRNYVINYFSALVSLSSLIVALASILKN